MCVRTRVTVCAQNLFFERFSFILHSRESSFTSGSNLAYAYVYGSRRHAIHSRSPCIPFLLKHLVCFVDDWIQLR